MNNQELQYYQLLVDSDKSKTTTWRRMVEPGLESTQGLNLERHGGILPAQMCVAWLEVVLWLGGYSTSPFLEVDKT
jgi:hypothetical protein